MIKNFLDSKLGSTIYISCSMFLALIFMSSGFGCFDLVEYSFASFLLCEATAFKFFWDGCIEINHYVDTHKIKNND